MCIEYKVAMFEIVKKCPMYRSAIHLVLRCHGFGITTA